MLTALPDDCLGAILACLDDRDLGNALLALGTTCSALAAALGRLRLPHTELVLWYCDVNAARYASTGLRGALRALAAACPSLQYVRISADPGELGWAHGPGAPLRVCPGRLMMTPQELQREAAAGFAPLQQSVHLSVGVPFYASGRTTVLRAPLTSSLPGWASPFSDEVDAEGGPRSTPT